jgi:hypothetical protein
MKIKFFKNKESQSQPYEIELNDWLMTDRFKNQITTLRHAGSKSMMDELKLSLPCAMPSLLIDGSHSGFIAIDVDGVNHGDNLDYTPAQLKEKVSEIANVYYCGYSASGLGVWALIPIKDTSKHIEHFRALEVVFERVGLKIDSGCSNVNRLRFCSYDPNPYFNENATVFSLIIDNRPKRKISVIAPGINKSADIFDEYNKRGDVVQLLTKHGWKELKEVGDRVFFRRPDKEKGISGEYSIAKRLFYCYTNSAQLEAEKGYNAVQLLQILECNNDIRQTALEIKKTFKINKK